MKEFTNKLNPFPIALSVLSQLDSDSFLRTVQSAGIQINLSLTEAEDYSHKTRLRAYLPRLNKAIQELDDNDALRAIYLIFDELIKDNDELDIESKLEKIGWGLINGSLAPIDSGVIELYFEKGLIHSAYQEIRRIVKKSAKEIYIIDPYIDSSIFELLKNFQVSELKIKILTLKKPPDYDHEKQLFIKQYSNLCIEEKITKDFHDRFIVVDNKEVYHLGASIKDAGRKVFMINKIEDNNICKEVISSFIDRWK